MYSNFLNIQKSKNFKQMKKSRITLLIVSILILTIIIGFAILGEGPNLFKGLNLVITLLIIGLAVIAFIAALKKDKEEKAGIPVEDELTTKIKYKSGYYAYLASMYMWLFIFLFKDKFTDIETMLGGGILLSALIGFIAKVVVKRNYNE